VTSIQQGMQAGNRKLRRSHENYPHTKYLSAPFRCNFSPNRRKDGEIPQKTIPGYLLTSPIGMIAHQTRQSEVVLRRGVDRSKLESP
jgi:hypothetical protein